MISYNFLRKNKEQKHLKIFKFTRLNQLNPQLRGDKRKFFEESMKNGRKNSLKKKEKRNHETCTCLRDEKKLIKKNLHVSHSRPFS